MPSQAEFQKVIRQGSTEGDRERIRFLDYAVDFHSGELFRAGQKIPLQEKPFQVLIILLRRPGELVTRNEICSAVWSDPHGQTGASLNTAMRKLRAAVGDERDNPHIIETVGSRGYRLLVQPSYPRWEEKKAVRLAVTPFRNLSGAEHDNFAEWLTEQMIVQLADPQTYISVVVPVSARHYREPESDICDAARLLNSDYILGGSVARTAKTVQVIAKLLRARDSACVWSQSYSRTITDVFRVQDEITLQIACSILPLLPRPANSTGRPESSLAAYSNVLKGRHFADKWNGPAFERAVTFFEKAIAEDPGFARAHGALARTYASILHYGLDRPSIVQQKLRSAAAKALELCPDLPKALVALGCAEVFYDVNWTGAERYFQRALEVNPSFSYAYQCYARLQIATGRHDESIATARSGRDLDPLSPYSITSLASAFYFSRRYEEGIAPCLECIEIEPGFSIAWALLGRMYEGLGEYGKAVDAYRSALQAVPKSAVMIANLSHGLALAGQSDESRKLLDQLVSARSSRYIPPYWIAVCFLGLGEREEAIRWLATALEERCAWRTLLAVDPKLDPLRNHPRFRELLKEVGFPQLAGKLDP